MVFVSPAPLIRLYFWRRYVEGVRLNNHKLSIYYKYTVYYILLMEEILHQLIVCLYQYLQCFYVPGGAGFFPSTVGISEDIQTPQKIYNSTQLWWISDFGSPPKKMVEMYTVPTNSRGHNSGRCGDVRGAR